MLHYLNLEHQCPSPKVASLILVAIVGGGGMVGFVLFYFILFDGTLYKIA